MARETPNNRKFKMNLKNIFKKNKPIEEMGVIKSGDFVDEKIRGGLIDGTIKTILEMRNEYPDLKNKKHIILKFLLEEAEDNKWYLLIGDYKLIDKKKANKIEKRGKF